MDADIPDPVLGTLRAIGAAAEQVTASGDVGEAGPDVLDLRAVEILAGEPFDAQEAAEKLVRDALRD